MMNEDFDCARRGDGGAFEDLVKGAFVVSPNAECGVGCGRVGDQTMSENSATEEELNGCGRS